MLSAALISGAASAAIALVAGVFLRLLHRRYVTPLDFPNKELAGEIEQTRVVQINCCPDKAIQLTHSALLNLPKTKNIATNGHRISAKTSMTFRTFGENISITAVLSGADSTELTIESKPRFSGTTLDYGKSYENVERIVANLCCHQPVRQLSANNTFKPTLLRGSSRVHTLR